MNTQYRFILHVECPDGKRHTHAFNLDAFEAPQFKPYDRCDSALAAMMAGGVMQLGAARIDADRKRLAEQIANKIADDILKDIKGRDLHNGYEQAG